MLKNAAFYFTFTVLIALVVYAGEIYDSLETDTLKVNTSFSGAAVLDEDDMASDSDTKVATQQSIKAFVDGISTTSPKTLQNIGLAVNAAASALTVDIKQEDGSTTPTGTTFIAFRSATVNSGAYNVRAISSDIDITIPSTATLGCDGGLDCYIWVYAIDNAGTIELCVATTYLEDSELQTSTAIDTSSDVLGTLYCDSLFISLPIRLIGRLQYDTAPNGTYAAIPDDVALPTDDFSLSLRGKTIVFDAAKTTTQAIANNTLTKVDWSGVNIDTESYFDFTTNDRFTPGIPGFYQITLTITYFTTTNAAEYSCHIFKNGVVVAVNQIDSGGVNNIACVAVHILFLDGDDFVEGFALHNSGPAKNIGSSAESQTRMSGFWIGH